MNKKNENNGSSNNEMCSMHALIHRGTRRPADTRNFGKNVSSIRIVNTGPGLEVIKLESFSDPK